MSTQPEPATPPRLGNVKVVSKLQAHRHLPRKASLLAVCGPKFARGVSVLGRSSFRGLSAKELDRSHMTAVS